MWSSGWTRVDPMIDPPQYPIRHPNGIMTLRVEKAQVEASSSGFYEKYSNRAGPQQSQVITHAQPDFWQTKYRPLRAKCLLFGRKRHSPSRLIKAEPLGALD